MKKKRRLKILHGLLCRDSGDRQLAGSAETDLVCNIANTARTVRQEDGGGDGVLTEFLESIKVLGDEQEIHNLLMRSVRHFIESIDRIAETISNGLTLTSETKTSKMLALCFCLCSLDRGDLLCFCLLHGGHTHTLGGVDLVHGVLHTRIDFDIGNKSLLDDVTDFSHGLAELVTDGVGDLLLSLEHLIEVQLGHGGTHNIAHVSTDLPGRIGELEEGVVLLALSDLILHRDTEGHEHIVLSLCFSRNIQLTNAERHGTGDSDTRAARSAGAAGLSNRVELTELVQDGHVLLVHTHTETTAIRHPILRAHNQHRMLSQQTKKAKNKN